MTVTVDLPDDVVQMLTLRNIDEDLPLAAGIRWLLHRGMEAAGDYTEEVAALQRDYPYSGLSEDEFDSFVHNVREEVWQERRLRSELPRN
jgi:hypothetical protein